MGLKKRYNDICNLPSGQKNLITDVPGVLVGHVTIDDSSQNTGVTVILPQPDNLFQQKLVAATHVINGFGKSVGLVQIDELGTLESPIILTNTFAVGTAISANIKYMLGNNTDIGNSTGTINSVVLECNDGVINNIRNLVITEEHVSEAIKKASDDFEEGAIGAGRGMSCYDLKGGIGSASRIISIDGKDYTIGVLVLANHGFLDVLNIYGTPIGKMLSKDKTIKPIEKGSIITVIATDIPFDSRQLKRLAKRSSVGVTRSGSFIGNGSGEITVAFSTANRVSHYENEQIEQIFRISENHMDKYFRAVVSAVDESILSVLVHAETVIDRNGAPHLSLLDSIKQFQENHNDQDVDKMMQRLGIET